MLYNQGKIKVYFEILYSLTTSWLVFGRPMHKFSKSYIEVVEVVLSTEYLIWSGRMLHSSATHAMLLQPAPILLLDLEMMIKSATFWRMIPYWEQHLSRKPSIYVFRDHACDAQISDLYVIL